MNIPNPPFPGPFCTVSATDGISSKTLYMVGAKTDLPSNFPPLKILAICELKEHAEFVTYACNAMFNAQTRPSNVDSPDADAMPVDCTTPMAKPAEDQ